MRTTFLIPILFSVVSLQAAESPEALAAAEQRREAIPLGGDFNPNPTAPAFVVVGHGGRILVSKDDARTWTQSFYGTLGADHGVWATRTMTYGDGLSVVAVGWGAPTSWLASDDGVNWRHLTSGATVLPEAKGNPRIMGEDFWLCGKPSRASADGKTWRDLPAAVPLGQVIASDQGTLVSIHPQRSNILRSADRGESWQEVYSYQPD
jgi:hypothetical protein